MSIDALLPGFAALSLGLLGAAGCAPPKGIMEGQQSSAQVQCHTVGAKLIVPAMTAEAICARFAAAIKSAVPMREAVSVNLTFLPNGVATAIVTRTRAGKPGAPADYNLAVSDRGFSVRDIDQLAANVAKGLRGTT